jgi:hypothetical protein
MSVRVQPRKIRSDGGSQLLRMVRYRERGSLSIRCVSRVQTEAYSGQVLRRQWGTNAGSSCPHCSQSRDSVSSLLRCVDVRQGAPV